MGTLFIFLGIMTGVLTVALSTKNEVQQTTEVGVLEYSKSYMGFNLWINISIFCVMIGLFFQM